MAVTPDRLVVSDRAHMLFDLHKEVDGLREAELSGNKIGTTKRGIGPAYASKATRNGVRVGDVRDPDSSPPGSARSPRTRRRASTTSSTTSTLRSRTTRCSRRR